MSMKHFRYRKVTPEIKAKMKELKEQGLSQRKIGKKLGVCQQAVCYHLNPESRRKDMERARKRQRTPKCREYQAKKRVSKERRKWMREYMKERYHKDPEHRRKMIRAGSGGRYAE